MQNDITIIGSGIGGLLCGVILAKEGFSVTILEKDPSPGGLLRGFDFKGVHFDTGMHYTGALQDGMVLHKIFRYAGIREELKLRKLDENGFDRVFMDGREYPLATGFDNFTDQLSRYFPNDQGSIRDYISSLKEIVSHFPLYNLRIPDETGLENDYHGRSARSFLDETIQNPILQNVLSGNDFLYGGLSNATPLSHLALVNHSFISGACRFIDGSNQVANLLVREFKRHGGKILCNTKVTGISRKDGLFHIDAEVRDPVSFQSQKIISSLHPAVTVNLAERGMFRDVFTSRIRQLRNTVSAFAVYAILKPGRFPYLNFNCYGRRNTHDSETRAWPNQYLLITPASTNNPEFAQSLEIISMMPWEEASAEFIHTRAESLLDLVRQQFPEIIDVIEDFTISTPATWERFTGSPSGSIYGIEKDCRNPLMTSISSRTHVPGFYFTGQCVNLHGMTGTSVGALMTCSGILGYDYLIKKLSDA